MNKGLSVVILAAGQGTRMKSDLPKVLHQVADRPLLAHVLDTALVLKPKDIHVVYGHGGDVVREQLSHYPVDWVSQEEQLGTGHAVEQAMPNIHGDQLVLVLYGDVPLTHVSTLQRLIDVAGDDGFSLLTAYLPDPTGYGRIIRDEEKKVQCIVEQKDANAEELKIKEVNTGMLAAPSSQLRRWLKALENNNAQGEFYLTDIVAMAVDEGVIINTVTPDDVVEIEGVNNKLQLAAMERAYQQQQAKTLMLDGVTLRDPARLDIRGKLTAGRDVVIDVNALFEGEVVLGDRVIIGPNVSIKDSTIGDGVEIKANTVIEDATIGADCEIGPFARIRPQTSLAQGAKVGNFVEIKKSSLGEGSKVNHLSYVGDTVMGAHVNVGAGTITCNYDGAYKHQTLIGDNVFIGSDTQLVAPVRVGDGATIGAGSTITRDVPAQELTLSRSEQKTRSGWKRPVKKK
jgi:bifunctional UDP-N-acetylglucosamine pyrophosphorylase/glucosamine-1-phosphate N-acetyltransferase